MQRICESGKDKIKTIKSIDLDFYRATTYYDNKQWMLKKNALCWLSVPMTIRECGKTFVFIKTVLKVNGIVI